MANIRDIMEGLFAVENSLRRDVSLAAGDRRRNATVHVSECPAGTVPLTRASSMRSADPVVPIINRAGELCVPETLVREDKPAPQTADSLQQSRAALRSVPEKVASLALRGRDLSVPF